MFLLKTYYSHILICNLIVMVIFLFGTSIVSRIFPKFYPICIFNFDIQFVCSQNGTQAIFCIPNDLVA